MTVTPTVNTMFRLLDLPSETIEGILTHVLFDCAHICHRCSRSRLSHPFAQLTQPVCLVNKQLHSLAVRLVFRVATLHISIVSDPSSTFGEAVTTDVSKDMETYDSTALVNLPEWSLWKEIVHYHVVIPATKDIDIGNDYWENDSPWAEKIGQGIRMDGCEEVAIYLKSVSAIKTLTICLQVIDKAEAERALEPLLEIRNVEKATFVNERADLPSSEYRRFWGRGWQSASDKFNIELDEGSHTQVEEEDLRHWEKIVEGKTPTSS